VVKEDKSEFLRCAGLGIAVHKNFDRKQFLGKKKRKYLPLYPLNCGSDKMPILVEVEVCLHSSSTARPSEVCDKVSALLERTTKGVAYTPGPIPLSTLKSDDFLARHVRHARICEILSPDAHGKAPVYLPSAGYWESELRM
jgi:hypothetical protein